MIFVIDKRSFIVNVMKAFRKKLFMIRHMDAYLLHASFLS